MFILIIKSMVLAQTHCSLAWMFDTILSLGPKSMRDINRHAATEVIGDLLLQVGGDNSRESECGHVDDRP